MNTVLDKLFADYEALKADNAAVVEQVRLATLADAPVARDVMAKFEAYLTDSRKLSKQLAASLK